MKDFCGICGQWKGLHEANTLHCPVDGTESGLFTETTYQDSDGMEATIAAQAARIAALEAALGNARIAMTFYREWMLAQDENSCTRYPFGIDAENAARYYRFTDDENTKRYPMAISVWNENKCRRKFIENNGCPHTNGTVYKWHTYPATLEEPSETVGRLYCDECGEEFELGYEPEEMELRWIEDAEYLEDR